MSNENKNFNSRSRYCIIAGLASFEPSVSKCVPNPLCECEAKALRRGFELQMPGSIAVGFERFTKQSPENSSHQTKQRIFHPVHLCRACLVAANNSGPRRPAIADSLNN